MLSTNRRRQLTRAASALRGLYAITDPTLTPPDLIISKVEQAVLGGAQVVQYRDNTANKIARQQQATALLELCRDYYVPVVINNDVMLADAVGAQGVHLGLDDMPISEARAILNEDVIIGASCYNDFARAERAYREGADYIAFGSFFPSLTKPEAVKAGLDLLRRARRQFAVPICAIGGITVDNAASLVDAGADLLAVIGDVFAGPEPGAAARKFAVLFE
jgi:thiamine-phosphate pyrophosphorylase